MSKIKIMDEILANKIAAGEVVERVASVVKELVENSIDASSTEIKVELIEAGTKEIKVIDNGVGMEYDDAIMAFNRHATSKIIDENDLYNINTLGFRGEALASIASVSKIKLETSTGKVGTEVIIHGGKVKEVNKSGARVGTIITVADLFYNTPARLKHMKSLYAELANVTEYMNKLALSHPDIKFILKNNDNIILNTDGSGDLLKTIKNIYGIDVVRKMIGISGENDDYTVNGFITKPEIHRSTRNHIIVLVNGRIVKNNELSRVINDAYHSYKPDNRYPIAILNIETDPSIIDVNIHPTKMDIKFSKIEELGELITTLIKNAIKDKNLIPKVEIKTETLLDDIVEEIKKPVYIEQTISFDLVEEPEEIYVNEDLLETEIGKDKLPVMYPAGLVHGTYIIAENETSMFLIDQHAAKERINYEFYKDKLSKPLNEKTAMLFPVTIELTSNEFIILKNNFDILKELGFDIEEFGVNSVIIKTHPTWLIESKEEEAIRNIVDIIIEIENKFSLEKFRESVATMMSCKLAIKANEKISLEEMDALIKDLSKCDNPFNCPHGRPTIVEYTNEELEKLFKRSGFDLKQ